MARGIDVLTRSSIHSGHVGRARQRTHKWRTSDGVAHPVTVRKVAPTVPA